MNSEYCVVTDNWLSYSMYDDWIERNFPNYIENFVFEHDIDDIQLDKLYKIIGKAPHLVSHKTILYLIQDMDTEQVFIVEEEGIKKCNTVDLTVDFNIQKSVYENVLKGDERNMDNRILDLYAERAKEKIKKEYETIVNNDYDKLDVVKEYNELVSTFNTSLAEMANRYNNEENTYLHRTGYELTPMYELSDDIKANIREKYLDEAKARLKDIDLLVEEVRAVLGVSNTEEYRIGVLKEYGIIDKKGKLNV